MKIKLVEMINKSKYKKLICLGLIILTVVLFVFILSVLFKKEKYNVYDYYDKSNENIVVSKDHKEKPGTLIRSTETLKKEHCKDDLCIKNIIIYYIKDEGRIEYEITNKGKRKATGALKLKFDNGNKIFIVYNKLKKNEIKKGVISFSKNDFSNVYDYTLSFASKKELDKLLGNKK